MAIRIEHIVVGAFYENTYFLIDERGDTIVVDPGGSGAEIKEYVRSHKLHIKMVINTHGHPDHIEANQFMKKMYGMPVLIHEKDARTFGVAHDRLLADEDIIKFAGQNLKVLHTPGHTMGSICILGEDFLLTGDTLFAGSIGRTDLGGDMAVMMDTLTNRLNGIKDDIILYPGHGPETKMERERRENPYLQPEG